MFDRTNTQTIHTRSELIDCKFNEEDIYHRQKRKDLVVECKGMRYFDFSVH